MFTTDLHTFEIFFFFVQQTVFQNVKNITTNVLKLQYITYKATELKLTEKNMGKKKCQL